MVIPATVFAETLMGCEPEGDEAQAQRRSRLGTRVPERANGCGTRLPTPAVPRGGVFVLHVAAPVRRRRFVAERTQLRGALASKRPNGRSRRSEKGRSAEALCGLTQAAADEAVGVHPVHVARIESGSANPTFSTLVAFAVAYNVPVRELFEA
jgi:DNA-binding XRE family transcriptional regulator